MEVIIICVIVGYAVFLGYLGKDREIGFWKAMASGLWRNSFSSESAITRIMKSPKLKSKTKFNKHKNGKDGKGPGQPSSEDGLQPAKYNANQEYSTPPQSTTNTNSSTSDTGSVFSGSGSAYDSNSYNTPSASDKKTSASSGTN